eukprot:CAMPEP_0185745668 /NCGR_PEP_ID=MMETSP1174-20130828/4074_1 /TAXON_ID=35687 /ORGANISM="Dictyocha speculum, Strain CCMP1381" /LENGTH=244 /DNA_ID=CAMNT_0028419835 /DNA_START=833 /DNA_END=1564 /DNA_ORIENTATION=-
MHAAGTTLTSGARPQASTDSHVLRLMARIVLRLMAEDVERPHVSLGATSTPALDAVLHCEKAPPPPSTERDQPLLPSSTPPMESGLVDHDPFDFTREAAEARKAALASADLEAPLIWKPPLICGIAALMLKIERRRRVATAAFLALCIPPLGEDEDYARAVATALCVQPLGGNYTPRAVGVDAKRTHDVIPETAPCPATPNRSPRTMNAIFPPSGDPIKTRSGPLGVGYWSWMKGVEKCSVHTW